MRQSERDYYAKMAGDELRGYGSCVLRFVIAFVLVLLAAGFALDAHVNGSELPYPPQRPVNLEAHHIMAKWPSVTQLRRCEPWPKDAKLRRWCHHWSKRLP